MSDLRKRAEEIFKKDAPKTENLSEIELQKLIEELQIHQIELQVQNEELRSSRFDIETAQKKYFNLFDLAPIGYLILNDKAIILELNLKASELFGRRKEYIVNHPLVSLLDASSMSKFYEYFQYIQNKQNCEPYELKIRNGTSFLYVELTISPYIDLTYLAVLTDITERKANDIKLQKSEAHFHSIFDNSQNAIFLLDNSGNYITVNRAFLEMTGYEADDFIDKKVGFHTHPDHIEQIHLALKKMLSQEIETFSDEIKIIQKNGKPLWISLKATIHYNLNEEFEYILVTFEDIDERKRFEIALLENEMFLKSLLHAIPVPIFYKDIHGRYIDVNESFEQFYGTKRENIIGKSVFDIASNEFAQIYHEKDLQILSTGEVQIYESQVKNTFGDMRDVIFHKATFLDSQGNTCGLIGAILDITERKKVEEALIQSELKFKEILSQINDGIIVFDEKGKIIIWNKGSEKIFGLSTKDAVGRDISEIQYQFAPPALKDKKLIDNGVQDVLGFRNPGIFNKIMDNEIIAHNSKNLINIQSIIFPIKFHDFNLFCSVFRDTTELKHYEKQLLQLNADKDRFISILAHDLRSPFNSILGFLYLLIENLDKYDIDKIRNQLNIINSNAKSTYTLLEDLLNWARVQSGKFPFKPIKINFTEICTEVIEVLKPNALSKSITINHFAEEEILLFADIDMLKTVLRNLISNALKFTDRGGLINVFGELVDGKAQITVSDNGLGIRDEVLAKLFDTAQVITTEGSASEKGTGLGLLLCKEFIEKHDGKIWVESKVGIGSNFIFTIPVYAYRK